MRKLLKDGRHIFLFDENNTENHNLYERTQKINFKFQMMKISLSLKVKGTI